MTGTRVVRALATVVVVVVLGASQPRPVVGTVVDTYTYPGGSLQVCVDGAGDHPACASPYEPARYYVSVRSGTDPDGPTSQIEIGQFLFADLEVGDRFELEMVGP